jgi:O-antigen/teichoic acid export membrane protein
MMKDALRYGIPLIPHMLGIWALSLIDRLVLGKLEGMEAVGRYSVAFQVACILGFVTMGVNQAFVPWLYGKLAGNPTIQAKKQVVKVTYLCIAGYAALAVLAIALFPVFRRLFINAKFSGIDGYFNLLTLGFLCQGVYFFFTSYIGYLKKTAYLGIIACVIIAVKVPLTYWLVKMHGTTGAALAYALTFVLFAVLTIIVSTVLYKMPWNIWKVVKSTIV